MKLLSTRDGREFIGELTTEHPKSLPGELAIRRLDNGQFIALRDCIGVPGAPGSTLEYQLLEVSPEERATLNKAGLVIADGMLRSGLTNSFIPARDRRLLRFRSLLHDETIDNDLFK